MIFFYNFYFGELRFSVDPIRGSPYILGETNSTKIVELNAPATIRCLAGGNPKPSVYWWRGQDMLSYQSTRFQINRDFSLHFNQIELADLGVYVCQAYSGLGKPVSIYITLKAVGPAYASNADEEQYLKYIISQADVPTTPRSYRPLRPRPEIPIHIPVIVEPHVVDRQPSIGKYCCCLFDDFFFCFILFLLAMFFFVIKCI